MEGCLTGTLLVIAVLGCGFYLPGCLISNSIEDLEGKDRYRARAAIHYAIPDSDPEVPSSIVREILTTVYHVEEAGRCKNPKLVDFSRMWPGLTSEQSEREFRAEMPVGLRNAPPTRPPESSAIG